VPDRYTESSFEPVSFWAKQFFFATRATVESILRPHGLGSTQWYVLYRLSGGSPVLQRELVRALQIERATVSEIVSTLVRKGLVAQTMSDTDQRQKQLQITDTGRRLWARLPNPVEMTLSVAFDGVTEADIALTSQVLQDATERLNNYKVGA
jgi:DNA-binding MarR family transcriptional regulator